MRERGQEAFRERSRAQGGPALYCNQVQTLIRYRSRSVLGYNTRLDLAALSEGLSAATQNLADHVGVFFTMITNSARALTYGDRLTSSFLAIW